MTKVLAASASAAIMLAGLGTFAPNPAAAADLFGPLRGTHSSMPRLTPVHNWDGAYFGGFAGATNLRATPRSGFREFINHELRLNAFATNTGIRSWVSLPSKRNQATSFGFFAGYNFQFDEAVLGFEFDYTSGNSTVVAGDSLTRVTNLDGLHGNLGPLAGETGAVTMSGESRVQVRDLMTLRARAGYTYGSMLPFVTGGVALARYSRSYTATQSVRVTSGPEVGSIFTRTYGPDTKSGYGFGLAAGAGMDVAITENLFLRGEWQYLHFRDLGGVRADLNNFRAGAAVKF